MMNLVMFNGIGCFKGTFPSWLKDDVKPYQVSPRNVAYALQESFKKEQKSYKNTKY